VKRPRLRCRGGVRSNAATVPFDPCDRGDLTIVDEGALPSDEGAVAL